MTAAKPSGFIHLRIHSAYSLSEGAVHIKQLAKLCQQHRMPAVAVADTSNMFGALEFSTACAGVGVQPILACQLPVKPEEEPTGRNASEAKPDILVLYAQSEAGYLNLLHLVSKAFLDVADNEPPQLKLSDIETRSEGLIALTGGVQGAIGRYLLEGEHEKAAEMLGTLERIFPNRLYIEIQRHGIEDEERIEPHLLEFAYSRNLPLVATNEVYFATREMYEAHDALLCVAGGRYVSEDNRRRLTPEYYFKSAEEMQALFADIPEAIENTLVIAKRCAFASPCRAPILPSFTTEEGRNEEDEFRVVAREGLEWRLEHFVFTADMDATRREEIAKPYRERLEFELDTIIQMQFPGYFLIVSDFIRWSKKHDIPVGPGRGSGAGSLVAWAMRITDLDPLRFGLLFERFLNPERVSMPDFDVDFCQDRREETIRYVQERYGADRVAQIITFGKLQARAVLRDVGRVLQMPYPQVDRICKLVPNNPANPCTLQEAIDMEPMLQEEIRRDAQVSELVNIALKLEGLYRHSSTHAAGVVIGDRPLQELVPLYRDPKSDMPVVQFSMKYAEMAGLVKFDFLGLKTLTVLSRACKFISRGGRDIDLLQLPMDDPASYKMMSEGFTVGVFQLESAGMRDTLRQMKPDCIEDIIALVSLYRPGPMDNIPTYCARKHGTEKPEYPHPLLEPILKETFGVIIYQEQVMQIAREMGGYSLGQADLLRRAMGKKIQAEMDAQRDTFVQGAVKKGVDEAKAGEVFELMAKFASYGFNKSHAAAYALIAFQTAYLKTHYPVEFLAASMSLDAGNTDKLAVFRQDAVRLGIAILPPDINASEADFSVEEQADGTLAVRYALGALKNVGMAAMEVLVKERQDNGAFKDIFDLAKRVEGHVINKRQLEYLIKAGAFDALHPNRRQLYEAMDKIVQYSATMTEEKNSSQVSLFGEATEVSIPTPQLAVINDWPMMEKLQYEFHGIGFYLSAHPLDAYGNLERRLQVMRSDKFMVKLDNAYKPVNVAGVLVGKKVKVSPKGRFAFLTLTDSAGLFELSVFDESLLSGSWEMLENGVALLIQAEGKQDESGVRLIANRISLLDDAVQSSDSKVTVEVNPRLDVKTLKAELGEPRGVGKRGAVITLQMYLEDKKVTIPLVGAYALTPPKLAALEDINGVQGILTQ